MVSKGYALFMVMLLSVNPRMQCVVSELTLPDCCGDTIGCYHDCTENGCGFIITWLHKPDIGCVQISMNRHIDKYDVYNRRWFALGLSDDKYMGSDSVIECVTDPYMYWLADVTHSYNDHYNNRKIFQGKNGLREVIGRMEDGVLSCNFTRTIIVEHIDKIFNLDRPWFLFVASGYMEDGSKLRHSLHPMGPYISPYKVDLRQHIDIDGHVIFYMVKIHGCLMVFAWLVITSISVVIARYFKQMWPDSKLCGRKVWYQIHKCLMILTFVCVLAAFIIIWVKTRGLSKMKGATTFQRTHPILGVVIMALTVLNPVMAFLKPATGTVSRPVFKYAHSFIGAIVYILSILNMIIGVTLQKTAAPFYTVWVVVGFAIYQLMFEAILELHECFLIKSGKQSAYEMKELTNRQDSVTSVQKDPPGSVFKKFLLSIHVVIIFGIGSTCIFLIAM